MNAIKSFFYASLILLGVFAGAISAEARFLSQDPVQYQPGQNDPAMFNRYAYSFNNPINLRDPDGRSPIRDMYHSKMSTGGQLPSSLAIPVDTGPGGMALTAIGLGTAGALMLATPAPEEVVLAGALAKAGQAASAVGKGGKTYQTYTKTNPKSGDVYTGRTSGTNSPQKNVENRDRNHHMNDQGFERAQLDQTSTNPNAVRGREQQMIDANGGAQSQGGTSGNAINGISPNNPKRDTYIQAAKDEFD